MMLPSFVSAVWLAYVQMSAEDRDAHYDHNLSVQVATCDERLLPYLAIESGLFIQRDDLSDIEYRALIQSTIETNRLRGTLCPMERSFEAMSIRAQIEEWDSYGGDPYHFRADLSLDGRVITAERLSKFHAHITAFKNVRSYLDEVVLSCQERQSVPLKTGGTAEMIATAVSVDSFVCTAAYPIPHTIGGTSEMIATARSTA